MADSLIAAKFALIEELRNQFVAKLYPELATQISPVLDGFYMLYVMWTAAMMVWQPGSFQDRAITFLKVSFTTSLIYVALGQDSSASPVFSFFINPLEEGSIKLSAFIISLFGQNSDFGASASLYGNLAAVVEAQAMSIWGLCNFIFRLADLSSGLIVPMMWAIFICFILMAPFIFVFIYFAFSLIDVMFSLLLIGSLSPLWLTCAVFESTRGYAYRAARIVAGTILVPPFLSVALGFSVWIIQPEIEKAQLLKPCALPGGKDLPACRDFPLDIFSYTETSDFILLVVLGGISVLLHLKARALASDLSQTADSGMPAAIASAVTMGALGAGKWGTIQGAKLTGKVVFQGGKAGLELAKHFMGGGGSPAGNDPAPSGAPANNGSPAKGGGSGGGPVGFDQNTKDTMKTFVDALQQFNKTMGARR